MDKVWDSLLILEENLIFDDINLEHYDRFRLSFDSKEIQNGSMPLIDFFDRVKYIKEIVSYSACSEIAKRPNFTRPFDDALNLIAHSKFAQTEIGSFVINILIPQGDLYIKKKEIENEEYLVDLGKRAIIRLIEGIEEIHKFEAKEESEFKKNYNLKLNKNVCKALKELMGSVDGYNLYFEFNKANSNKTRSKIKTEIIAKKDYKKYNRITGYLSKDYSIEKTFVFGKIITQDKRIGNNSRSKKKFNWITIKDNSLRRNISLVIDKSNFNESCIAFQEDLQVSVRGDLDKPGKFWILSNPEDFNVFQPGDELPIDFKQKKII